jgi:eukaryotic-like serine/threonine-protein kinase
MTDEPMTTTPQPHLLVRRYEVLRLLGTGGMAEVFEGRDRLLARRVAVKILLPQFARDPAFLARFRREAQAAASLSHPNIVGIFDSGAEGETHFIIMEYVDGRSLRDVLRDSGPLQPQRAAEIGGEVCAGLGAAHARGLVHRDIKPGNIMLTPDGTVKVMDFGIARAAASDTITQTQMVVGTAQYISPEQAQGLPIDFRSDLYSLGCCLYEMLTGQPPFTGATPVAIAYRHVRETPVPPRQLNPDVPAPLEAVVMKALAKNPANRYQTAAEVRADLGRARAGVPVEATPLLDPALLTVPGHQPAAPPLDAQATQVVAPLPGPSGPSRFGDGYVDDLGVPPRPPGPAWPWLLAALLAVVVGAAAGYTVVRSMVATGAPATTATSAAPPATPASTTPPATAVPSTAAPAATAPPVSTAPATTAQTSGEGQPVRIPADVIGMRIERAQPLLESLGLRVRRHPIPVRAQHEVGRVQFTQPAPGSTVPPGSAVDVFVGRLA